MLFGNAKILLRAMISSKILDLLKPADGNTTPAERLDDVNSKRDPFDVVGEVVALILFKPCFACLVRERIGQMHDVLLAELVALHTADRTFDAVIRRPSHIDVPTG